MTAADLPIVLTMPEVAQVLRCHVSSVSRLIASGALEPVPNMGKRKVVARKTLLAFIGEDK